MLFQKIQSSCCLQSKSSLNCEVSGRERRFRFGAEARDGARGRSIMKHTNTQLCVDNLPLFLPIPPQQLTNPSYICSSRPDSAHGGVLPHLAEPNSRVIFCSEENEAGGPHYRLESWRPLWVPGHLKSLKFSVWETSRSNTVINICLFCRCAYLQFNQMISKLHPLS